MESAVGLALEEVMPPELHALIVDYARSFWVAINNAKGWKRGCTTIAPSLRLIRGQTRGSDICPWMCFPLEPWIAPNTGRHTIRVQIDAEADCVTRDLEKHKGIPLAVEISWVTRRFVATGPHICIESYSDSYGIESIAYQCLSTERRTLARGALINWNSVEEEPIRSGDIVELAYDSDRGEIFYANRRSSPLGSDPHPPSSSDTAPNPDPTRGMTLDGNTGTNGTNRKGNSQHWHKIIDGLALEDRCPAIALCHPLPRHTHFTDAIHFAAICCTILA